MHQLNDTNRTEFTTPERRASYAEWIALGAVIAGSVGALVGAAKCSKIDSRTRGLNLTQQLDPSTLTPPHGDKLPGAMI